METTTYALKSLADLKRAIKTAKYMEMTYHFRPDMPWNSPAGVPPVGEMREIVKRQTNCVGVRMLRRDGTETISHLQLEKASAFRFDGSDVFHCIDHNGDHWASYRLSGAAC